LKQRKKSVSLIPAEVLLRTEALDDVVLFFLKKSEKTSRSDCRSLIPLDKLYRLPFLFQE